MVTNQIPQFDADDNDENGGPTRVDLIYSSQQSGPSRLDLIETFLKDWGVDKKNINRWSGSAGSGDGEARGSPQGKAVVQVCVRFQFWLSPC
jgi:hypothetical protein